MTRSLLVACLLCAGLAAAAQSLDYRKAVERAERAQAEGRIHDAADAYAAAYADRPGKGEFAATAAEFYARSRDYAAAAKYFNLVAADVVDYPRAGLGLARALKQLGRYDAAAVALKAYRDRYRGEDHTEVMALVGRAAEGLRLAKAEVASPSSKRRAVPFGGDVNGPRSESAPMPLAPGAVYYLHVGPRASKPAVWRASRLDDGWGAGAPAKQFPAAPGFVLGAGSLGPTGDRFYLGLCQSGDGRGGEVCGLYVTIRGDDGTWGYPEPLPSYVNVEGVIAKDPYAYRDGEREVVLFASDRPGGRGGTDLYRIEREVTSEANDFTFPESLGDVVNGPTNEASPYYDPDTRLLHFSSDDGGGLGGYDVYRSEGARDAWTRPVNLLAPVNGPGDELGYREIPERDEAVLASNRPLESDTTDAPGDDNLFAILPGAPTTPVAVSAIDSVTGRGIAGASLTAYRGEAVVASARANDGYFNLNLPLGADLTLVVNAPDYRVRRVRARTPARVSRSFQLPPVALGRRPLSILDVRDREAERDREVPAEEVPARIVTADTTAGAEVRYRIQIEARRNYDARRSRYESLRAVGDMSSNRLSADGLYRVFVGDFATRDAAAEQLDEVESAGFPGAFIVEFAGEGYRGISRKPTAAGNE